MGILGLIRKKIKQSNLINKKLEPNLLNFKVLKLWENKFHKMQAKLKIKKINNKINELNTFIESLSFL